MNETASYGYGKSLVCPVSKLPLIDVTRSEAESLAGMPLRSRNDLQNAKGGISKPAGITEMVLLREDHKLAYPTSDGIPILLAPEALAAGTDLPEYDLSHPKYAEAYEEMEFYNSAAKETLAKLNKDGAWSILPTEMVATQAEKDSFPAPWFRWIDATHDSAAQWESYDHLGKMPGRRFLQLGGSGTHVIKFLMAGAEECWLATPMLGEAMFGRALAESAGVGDRFRAVVGIAEELPLRSEIFDGIFAGGCLHHMVTDAALPEAARVLRPGGKFAAAEPWRAPLYSIGTKILGKREDAYCRPLTNDRVSPLKHSFSSFELIGHGTVTRYPFLALEKFGFSISKSIPWHIGRIDDALCSLIPGARRMGSSVTVLATK